MSERRPFAEDIPELEWEHDTPDRCTIVWGCKLPHGQVVTCNDPDSDWRAAALVRAGIRIGEQRAAANYDSLLYAVDNTWARWWLAAKRALAKVLTQRDACMRGQLEAYERGRRDLAEEQLREDVMG